MTLMRIRNITTCDDLLDSFYDIELVVPSRGDASGLFSFDLTGWALGRHTAVRELRLSQNHVHWKSVPVNLPVRHIIDRYPNAVGNSACGFHACVGVLGLDPNFSLEVNAVFRDSRVRQCATIEGSREPVRTSYFSRLNPIVLTSLARTGTTRLMQTLSSHPSIVVNKRYPFEARPGCYWLHMLKVLAEPSNGCNTFEADLTAVPACPMNSRAFTDVAAVQDWFGREYVLRLAEFSQRSIDRIYETICGDEQVFSGVRYFAEKCLPCHLQPLFAELYPNGKEIVLVRDFRDMVCSMISFNNKRGFATFGRERVNSDAEFIVSKRQDILKLTEAVRSRADSLLCIRYEDLILAPAATLQKVFQYLEIESDDSAIEQVIEADRVAGDRLSFHRTTSDAVASIGRWRRDLPLKLQAVCSQAFGDLFSQFGYES